MYTHTNTRYRRALCNVAHAYWQTLGHCILTNEVANTCTVHTSWKTALNFIGRMCITQTVESPKCRSNCISTVNQRCFILHTYKGDPPKLLRWGDWWLPGLLVASSAWCQREALKGEFQQWMSLLLDCPTGQHWCTYLSSAARTLLKCVLVLRCSLASRCNVQTSDNGKSACETVIHCGFGVGVAEVKHQRLQRQ